MRLLSVKVHAVAKAPKPIFQAYPQSGSVKRLEEVSEAFRVCKKMSDANARDYFYSIGIDFDNAKAYLPTVLYLEQCYLKSGENLKEF